MRCLCDECDSYLVHCGVAPVALGSNPADGYIYIYIYIYNSMRSCLDMVLSC